jgi:hypothetical protein
MAKIFLMNELEETLPVVGYATLSVPDFWQVSHHDEWQWSLGKASPLTIVFTARLWLAATLA